MALGAFFVAIALAVAGCGSSGGVPSGAVASVAGNPITKRALDHWMYTYVKGNASQSPGTPVIVPNDPPAFTKCIAQARSEIPSIKKDSDTTIKGLCGRLFAQLNQTELGFLIQSYWYQAEAHKLGIKVSNAAITKELSKAKKEQGLKTQAQYTSFLKKTGYTAQDINYEIRISLLQKKLLAKHSTKVTSADIASYYKSHASTFGTPEQRNLRIVLAKNATKAKAALSALRGGKSWSTVAKKYSTDPTTKDKGGVLDGVEKGQQDAALDKAAFAAPANKLEGPVKAQFGYYVLEVTKITPATHQSLKAVSTQIKETLLQKKQQAAETAVTSAAKKAFLSRTVCATAYAMADCKGYKAPKTTSTAATGAATTPPATATATSTSSAKKKSH
jgi:foldase protein PrsA